MIITLRRVAYALLLRLRNAPHKLICLAYVISVLYEQYPNVLQSIGRRIELRSIGIYTPQRS